MSYLDSLSIEKSTQMQNCPATKKRNEDEPSDVFASKSMRDAMIDDLRRARLEKWCRKHGRKVEFELKDKVALRKWFYTLDANGSGEVIADELHDPMLSTGILRTKNQVYSTLLSMDSSKNRSKGNGVSFEVFQKAIHKGAFADKSKLNVLQGFCENQHGFGVDTLCGIERRKVLFKAILDSNLSRDSDIEAVWNKPNTSYEGKLAELRHVEEAHAIAGIEQEGYLEDLQEALVLNKRQRAHKEAVKQEALAKLMKQREAEEASRAKLPPVLQRAAAGMADASTSFSVKGPVSNNNSLDAFFAKTPRNNPTGVPTRGGVVSTEGSFSISTANIGAESPSIGRVPRSGAGTSRGNSSGAGSKSDIYR